jgi:hypothetical protein
MRNKSPATLSFATHSADIPPGNIPQENRQIHRAVFVSDSPQKSHHQIPAQISSAERSIENRPTQVSDLASLKVAQNARNRFAACADTLPMRQRSMHAGSVFGGLPVGRPLEQRGSQLTIIDFSALEQCADLK